MPLAKIEKWKCYLTATLLLILTATIGVTLYRHALPFAGGADSSGYIHFSKLISNAKLHTEVRPIGQIPLKELSRPVYQPLGFQTSEELDSQTPLYPIGYPLILAPFSLISDNETGILIATILIGCLTPIATFFLSRKIGIRPLLALGAAITTAVSPLYLFMALQPMSDLIATLLSILIILLTFLSLERRRYAIILGACISLSVLIRTPNILICLPVGFILLANKDFKKVLPLALGGTPGFIFFLLTNSALYGSPIATGYESILSLFKTEYFGTTMKHFAFWLNELYTPVITVGFSLSLILIRTRKIEISALWIWAGSFTVFYAFYYHSHETWWYLRFILPAIPAIIVGAFLTLETILDKTKNIFSSSWFPIITSIAIVIYITITLTRARKDKVYFDDPAKDTYALTAEWAKSSTNERDAFVSMQNSGCLFYYAPNPIIRYDVLSPKDWQTIQSAHNEGDFDIYAAIFSFEIEELKALSERAPGNWTFIKQLNQTHVFKLEKTPSR